MFFTIIEAEKAVPWQSAESRKDLSLIHILARVDGGAGVILSAHVSLGSWPIFAYGTEEQKKKYLVPLAKGEKIGAFGLTEPDAGSDAGGTETTALDKGCLLYTSHPLRKAENSKSFSVMPQVSERPMPCFRRCV